MLKYDNGHKARVATSRGDAEGPRNLRERLHQWTYAVAFILMRRQMRRHWRPRAT
jgi:hypothetical protein